jgi:hypothetical protein
MKGTTMGDKIVNVFGSIVILAIVTTLVLPNRQTARVIDAASGAFQGGIRSAMGDGK